MLAIYSSSITYFVYILILILSHW